MKSGQWKAARVEEEDLGPEYSAGDVLVAKYRLVELLGEGGMGSVWGARELATESDVAVKLIRRGRATPDASARLLQEGRAAAGLQHPSIVRVLDFGITEHGDPFIVMELLRGVSLATALDRRGKLPVANAVRILLPVVSALATAHDSGIVHRDLKPDNIFVARTAAGGALPKVVDFGIAKFRREPDARHTTETGVVLGSPDYMSPEQARGRGDIDERSDIWALAVVLYEVVTGQRPFGGQNYNEQLSSILLDDAVPILDFGVGDERLWAILSRALSKERADRWQTMQEFGRAIAAWALARDITGDICGGDVLDIWFEGDQRLATATLEALGNASPASVRPPSVRPPGAGAPRVPTARIRSAASTALIDDSFLDAPAPPPTRKRRRRRWPLMVAAVALLSAGAAIVMARGLAVPETAEVAEPEPAEAPAEPSSAMEAPSVEVPEPVETAQAEAEPSPVPAASASASPPALTAAPSVTPATTATNVPARPLSFGAPPGAGVGQPVAPAKPPWAGPAPARSSSAPVPTTSSEQSAPSVGVPPVGAAPKPVAPTAPID